MSKSSPVLDLLFPFNGAVKSVRFPTYVGIATHGRHFPEIGFNKSSTISANFSPITYSLIF